MVAKTAESVCEIVKHLVVQRLAEFGVVVYLIFEYLKAVWFDFKYKLLLIQTLTCLSFDSFVNELRRFILSDDSR